MKLSKFIYLCIIFFMISSCATEKAVEIADINIIPKPQQVEKYEGFYKLNKNLKFKSKEFYSNENRFFYNHLNKTLGYNFNTPETAEEADILFIKNNSLGNEEYILEIDEQITLQSNTKIGMFYGIQTLIQILPVNTKNNNDFEVKIPKVKIQDAPKFQYRGMHLDVSRHFFPKKFIKQYISYLAMLKMNTFHWHLTDDQGWRIEIKQYPDLTSKGAYREETLIGHYNTIPQQFDGKKYGGFYNQEDIKEIVAFAKQHHITIIPEIEMPGHAQAAISAYPELGCTGKQVPVATKWGVFENIYCPNQKTMAFLKNTLREVMDIFPGEYIHIGGDEAPKTQWKNCSHCQQLIKQHKLKDEAGLQSWFIKEIETFVNSKGKKIIGWDEILEGGLAPNATVMSWRGTKGAVEAAKQGNNVILTPTSHAYFDYYQDDHPDEPLAIGGYLPLKKVYSFNPIPEELTTEEEPYVLGAQGNVWTEYMATPQQVEYMLFPRILAMSEVVWTGPTTKIAKQYPEFISRVASFSERLEYLGINYANHLYDLEGKIIKEKGRVFYALTTPTQGVDIKYTINTSEEKIYKKPILITEDTNLTAQVYKDSTAVGRPLNDTIHYHKGINASIAINVAPHPAYGAGGKEALLNGIKGSTTRYGDKEWLGFWGDDLEITITFPKPTLVNRVKTRFYNANGQWIYAPAQASLFALDMEHSKGLSAAEDQQILDVTLSLIDPDYTTSLVLKVENFGLIPEGLQGAGNKAWTFIDEIIIE